MQPIEIITIRSSSLPKHEKIVVSEQELCGIFFCREGDADILLDEKPYRIGTGDMYFYFPSSRVQVVRRSADLWGEMIVIDMGFLQENNEKVNPRWGLYLHEHPCISLSDGQRARIERSVETLRRKVREKETEELSPARRTIYHEQLLLLFRILCYDILDIYLAGNPLQPVSNDRKERIFQKFIISLYHNHRKEREVTFYAQEQYLTPRYFSSLIKEKSGQSALQWIIRSVVTDAKQLLRDPAVSIKEIASLLNFSSQSFFGKYFKQYVGVSPSEYRAGALLRNTPPHSDQMNQDDDIQNNNIAHDGAGDGRLPGGVPSL
ncbi:MAG: helix-turn-helix transcriptional regulator [Alistipes sp.]|nr:helix-turn-helix transcriptional regulator [Alistipes sp.]